MQLEELGRRYPEATTAGERRLAALLERLVPGWGPALVARPCVLAAHPGDEALGATWLLACTASQVRVLHLTDGGRPAPGGARPRRDEALEALACVGVVPAQVRCLGASAREAAFALAALTEALAARLRAEVPTLLLVQPYEGGHPDHDAAAFVAHAAAERLRREGGAPPVLLEMTGYHARDGAVVRDGFLAAPHGRSVRVPLHRVDRARRARMLGALGSLADALPHFCAAGERLRLAPRYDFRRPPHPGPLYYEQQPRHAGGVSAERWCALARAALEELGLQDAACL